MDDEVLSTPVERPLRDTGAAIVLSVTRPAAACSSFSPWVGPFLLLPTCLAREEAGSTGGLKGALTAAWAALAWIAP